MKSERDEILTGKGLQSHGHHLNSRTQIIVGYNFILQDHCWPAVRLHQPDASKSQTTEAYCVNQLWNLIYINPAGAHPVPGRQPP
jgi:hypothetical protein